MLGPLGASVGCQVCRGIRCVLGGGRECNYSGARRGIGSIRGIQYLLGGVGVFGYHYGHWVIRGCRGCQGCTGAGRECRYLGGRRSIGGLRGHWGFYGM